MAKALDAGGTAKLCRNCKIHTTLLTASIRGVDHVSRNRPTNERFLHYPGLLWHSTKKLTAPNQMLRTGLESTKNRLVKAARDRKTSRKKEESR